MTPQDAVVLAAAVGGTIALFGAFLADRWARDREQRTEDRLVEREAQARVRDLAYQRVTQTGQQFMLTCQQIEAFVHGDQETLDHYLREQAGLSLWLGATNFVGRDEVMDLAADVVAEVARNGFGVPVPVSLADRLTTSIGHVRAEIQDQMERVVRDEAVQQLSPAVILKWNAAVSELDRATPRRRSVSRPVRSARGAR